MANLENDGSMQARAAEENADTVKLIAEQRADAASSKPSRKRKTTLGDDGQIRGKSAPSTGAPA